MTYIPWYILTSGPVLYDHRRYKLHYRYFDGSRRRVLVASIIIEIFNIQ